MKAVPPLQRLLAFTVGFLLTTLSTLQAGWVFFSDLTTGGTASGSPARFPAAETPPMAFDNVVTTKGLIFNDVANDNASPYEDVTSINPAIWTYAFAGGTQNTVLSYSLTSANDAPERDPRDFFLEGSLNGTIWTIVDTVTGQAFLDQPGVGDNTLPPGGANRFETYFFTIDAPNSFSQYRLRVIETFGTTNDRPQIAEIQLFSGVIPEPGVAGLSLFSGALLFLRRRSGGATPAR
jgi:hypothetical protein